MGKFEDFDLDLKVHKEKNNAGEESRVFTKNLQVCTGTVGCPGPHTTKSCGGFTKGCISTKDCSTKVCPGSTGRR